jgi:FkbM family methyltransferase
VQLALSRHLRPGCVFYDIGANVGFFSLITARLVGPTGMVYSFEPLSENAEAIRQNARINGLENLMVLEAAASETSGLGELFVTEWDGGGTLASPALRPPRSVGSRTVRTVAVDELVDNRELRAPSVVKIDVEGAELDVIRGMQRTLARFGPIILYEVDAQHWEELAARWDALDAFVTGLGYAVTRLENAYPALNWHVGHSLAVPLARSSSTCA